MPIRPGDVLADRYRLVDLLVESGSGRFWRAHDRVLERHVALHVLDAEDERAAGLLEAARRSATVPDRRLLRVLDADRVNGLCYVVNEWGAGSSLDIMLATEGVLAPRRAAWLVSEVAASVAAGHEAGVAHGRLVPENVLVDRTGSVRVIGFCVDAALHGLPAGRVSTDVADLGGLLYSALTGRWPGVSRSEVPDAPHEHGRVLRPRQVRAGIPRPLDALCDQVVNPYAGPGSRDGYDLSTARGIADYLADFVGDPTGMAEAEAASNAGPRGTRTVVLPGLPTAGRTPPQPRTPVPPATPAVTEPDEPVEPVEPVGMAVPEQEQGPEVDDTDPAAPAVPEAETVSAVPETVPAVPAVEAEGHAGPTGTEPTGTGQTDTGQTDPEAGASSSTEQPTQAGLPIFDDANDDVSWLSARPEKPPPPPPFEDVPERPLFAPEPAEGEPARKPRPNAAGSSAPRDYWPWDTSSGTGTGVTPLTDEDEDDDEVPGRSWLRLAAAIGASLVLLLAIVVAFNLGRGRTPLGGAKPEEKPSRSSSASATPPAPITGLSAQDFDPQGSPPEEHPELASLAVDGNPATAWRTMTYTQNFGPGGLKTGVGLIIDLGAVHDVASVDLTFVGAPTAASLYVTGTAPTAVAGLSPAATVAASGTHQRVTIDHPARGRYLTVWLTSLPQGDGGYRGEVAEVSVRG